MSLLMDALKKAEKEKKEAARRLKDAEPQDQPIEEMTLTQELSTEDDLDLQQNESAQPGGHGESLDVNTGMESMALSPLSDHGSILEDGDSSEQNASEEDPHVLDLSESDSMLLTSELAIAEEDESNSGAGDMKLTINEDKVSAKSADLDETLAPAPTDFQLDDAPVAASEDTIQAVQKLDTTDTISENVDEYFSATVSAVQLAEDIGGDSPTPVAAQTVFTAISTKPGNQVMQWGAFVVLCLVIAVSLSFIIFNYTVPVERSIKSPLVAKDIETQSEPMPVIEIPDELVSSTELDSHLFTGEISKIIDRENAAVTEERQAESETISATGMIQENVVDNLSESGPEGDIGHEQISTPEEENLSGEDLSVAEAVEEMPQSLPEEIVLEPKLIKITRSIKTNKSSVLINKAYQEYLTGNYETAEKYYRNVLNKLPENRDALLGLASISVQKGNLRQAYTYYLEILRYYPGDSVAEAALINFKRNGDYVRDESILKTFIQREPENSFLYYSLGHLHAVQRQWPEAQQSFFNAYRLETSNPDYAFNLAVSLDHIGQQQSAIDYYNVALELADSSTTSFDSAVVISRIKALSGLADLQ